MLINGNNFAGTITSLDYSTFLITITSLIKTH